MEQLEKRTSRIIGQMRGIEKMVKGERDYIEILQQVSAVKKAIDGLSKEIVSFYIHKNVAPEKIKEFEEMVDRLISI